MKTERTDYRDIPKFEGLYLINKFMQVKALDRTINYKDREIVLKQISPQVKKINGTTYGFLRNEYFKNRKVNLNRVVLNVFGRQKPIIKKEAYVYVPVIKVAKKQVNKKGAAGEPVEQWNDGILVNEFPSLCAAGKAIGIDYRKISNAAYGVYKYAGGYEWKFKNSNNK